MEEKVVNKIEETEIEVVLQEEYRLLAHLKVTVDKYFNDVQVGRKLPGDALRVLKYEIGQILKK